MSIGPMMHTSFKYLSALILCVTLLIVSYNVSGQSQNYLPKPVIPPSPDAAAIGKYGSIPVGLHTGIPNIDIPLYTIRSKELEVPISLSYHASGNKVGEISSWIGLGWTLNAGGVVSRTVVGKPDENSGFWTREIKSANEIDWTNDHYYMKSIADGTEDGESDLYFYNFNGRSGKFVYGQNEGNQTPILIPEAPIRFNWISTGLEAIDEAGTTYKFGAVELGSSEGNSFGSSYYLSEIISADGSDHIYFSYLSDNAYGENNVPGFSETIGLFCSDGSSSPYNGYHVTEQSPSSRGITSLRLKEITFSNGKVEFIADNTRQDTPPLRLGEIRISSKNIDGSYTIRKTFVLGEGYFYTGSGTHKDNYRLKLTGITERDALATIEKHYTFAYDEVNNLPPRTSLAQDWWGLYNGQNYNTSLIETDSVEFQNHDYSIGGGSRSPNASAMQANILKRLTYPTGGYTEFDYEPHRYDSGKIAGGLRVNEVRDYVSATSSPLVKRYKYGIDESGDGVMIAPLEELKNSEQEINFIHTAMSGTEGYCTVACLGLRKIISSRPPVDLSTLSGAPVVYAEVTVYEGDGTSSNGKNVFKFDVEVDQTTLADKAYNNGRYQLNDSWKGGDEIWNGVYKSGSTTPVAETSSTYEILKNTDVIGTKVGWKVSFEGCAFPAGNTEMNNTSYFYVFDYPMYSGVKKLTSTTSRTYSSNSTSYVETKTDYEYDDLGPLHQQLTSKITLESDGSTVKSSYWYPADYDSSGVMASLLAKNIIATPIKEETFKNGEIIAGKVTVPNENGKPIEIHSYETAVPQAAVTHDGQVILPAGYVKKLEVTYDSITKNLNKTQLSNNLTTSYLWDYNDQLPIAMISNAAPADVAATSFESGGKGNWTFNGATYNDIAVKTGTRYYKLGSGKDITKSLPAGKYQLAYWAKGTVNLAGGSIATIRTSSADVNGWILYEKEVTMTSTTTLTLSGNTSAFVEELRVYPATAQITTYTYDVSDGITTINDTNNVITYYEYDSFGRLKLLKDQYGNIVKAYDYHYKGY